MTPPKGQNGKDKPFRTRTYRRSEGGSATEGFDAAREEGAPPRRNSFGDGAPKRKTYGDGAPKRKTYGDGPPKRKSFGEGAPKRSYERRERTFDRGDRSYASDRPKRPARSEEGWKRIPPAIEAESEAGESTAPRARAESAPAEGMAELTLTIPSAMLRQLEGRAREIGVGVEPLVQVWLADKLKIK